MKVEIIVGSDKGKSAGKGSELAELKKMISEQQQTLAQLRAQVGGAAPAAAAKPAPKAVAAAPVAAKQLDTPAQAKPVKVGDQPKSVDPGSLHVIDVAAESNVQLVWDRLAAQQPQCNWGAGGICCRICSMGPLPHQKDQAGRAGERGRVWRDGQHDRRTQLRAHDRRWRGCSLRSRTSRGGNPGSGRQGRSPRL